jgi:hypothetical protein
VAPVLPRDARPGLSALPRTACRTRGRARRIVHVTAPVSLLAGQPAGTFGCTGGGAVTGTFTAVEPFPVEIDLDALRWSPTGATGRMGP